MKKLLYMIPGIHCLLSGWLLVDTLRFAGKLISASQSADAASTFLSLHCLWGIEFNDFIPFHEAPEHLLYIAVITLISIVWTGFVCVVTHEKVRYY